MAIPILPEAEIYRNLGTHEAEIDNLKKEVAAMRKDLSEIKSILNEAKGGWRTLMAMGGLAASVSSVATWAFIKIMDWGHR